MSKKIEAGRAQVVVEVNRSRLAAGLEAARKQLVSFAASSAKIGAGLTAGSVAMLTPIAAMAKTFASNGDMLDKMSGRTGASVEALGELAHAAGLSGTSIETVEKSIRKMQQQLSGNGDLFRELGLDPDKLKAMPPEQAFAAIADRINSIENPAERVAAAIKLFGESGAQLLPMLSAGSSGMAAMAKDAQYLGVVMSGKDSKAAADLTDQMDRLYKSFTGLSNVIGASVAPMFSAVLSMMTHGVVQVRQFVDANRGMVIAAALGAVALGLLGAGFVTAAGLAYGLSVAISVATSVASAAGTVFAVLGTVLTGGVGLAIAAVVIGLVGLAGYFAYTSGVGGKAMDWLGGKFAMLEQIAGPVFQGIQDAMKGGDFQLAAQILWQGLQLAWLKGTDELRATWDTWLNGLLGSVDSFIAQFRSKWNDVSGWLADRMLEAYGSFDESFDAAAAKQMRAEDTARQNKSFAAGAANRAAGRDAAAEANIAKRQAAIAELEAALAASTAKAAAVAADVASLTVDQGMADFEAPEQADAPKAAQADNQFGKASDSMRGTFSGFAAALMGQSGAYDLDAEMLAENKAQTQYLAEMAGALVATKQTQVMLEGANRDPATAPGTRAPKLVAELDPALNASLVTANTTLGSILRRLKEMEGGFA